MSSQWPVGPPGPVQTILIVDDDPIFRSLMRAALSDIGLEVLEAADGVEALVCCQQEAPSLLVIDAVMPNIDGFTLCRELRGRDATRNTPILMVTGLDDDEAFDRAYEAGATDFIVKPVDWPSMALRVRYVLRNMAAIADLRDEPPAGAMPRRRTKAPRQPVPRPPGSAPILPPAQDDEPVSVLIVDDDAILRTLMRSSLESEGYAVIEAEDGLAAYRACQDRVPALVISDIVMPELNGFELCRLLRQRAQTESVPILVVTGLDDHRSVAEAYDAGATDFIVKPLNWLILKYRIRYMLRAARAYADLAIAKERAEAANRSKSTLLANMTHELRTPLNAVIGFSEIMHRQELGPLSERYTEYAKIIGDSGSHLLTIINDLLDLAKTEAQGIGIADEAVSIPDIVSFCTGVVDPMAQGAEIALLMDVEPGLPPFRGDGKKLQQILINLLGNAIKFTPNGGQVSLRASRGPAGGLVFQIQDTGVGIAADKIALALAPFGQIASSETRKNDGAGLGLPLARHLTELHDGTLEIDSAPGTGTTVIVRFPAERFIDGRGRNSDNGGSGTRRRDPVDV